MTETLLRQFADGVLTLTLNRPQALNALDQRLSLALTDATRDAADDPDVRAVVLRGAGRAFCAGGDLKTALDPDPANALSGKQSREPGWPTSEMRNDRLARHGEAALRLHTMGKPTLAMLHGVTAGAGLALALACDIRLCADSARFTTAFAKVGYSGDYGISYLLPLVVGQAKAREMMFLSDLVDATAALAAGMVNRVMAEDALEQATMTLARRLAQGPTVAYRYIKSNLAAAASMSFEQSLELERINQRLAALSADHLEARNAFIEKREPRFRGV